MIPIGTLILFLFGLSGGFWMIYGFYISFRIEWFIVKRYEVETDLMDAIFFKEHATFTRSLPPFFSSALYTGHLLMLLWGWRIYSNKKAFRDIDKPSKVLCHFSSHELRKVKMFGISCIVVVLHMIVLYVLDYFRPELFR
jgi:hypothetical protein